MTADDKKELKEGYVHLKEYFEMLFEERQKQMLLRFDSTEKALTISSETLKRDLEHLNQLRSEVTEDRGLLVRHGVFTEFKQDLERWKIQIGKEITKIETRYDTRIKVPTVIAAVAVVVSIISMIVTILHK